MLKRHIIVLASLALLMLGLVPALAEKAPEEKEAVQNTVMVITLDGVINPVASEFIGKGIKKAAVELVQGDDLYRKSGKWNKMKRLIDRTGDDYEKLIVDPDTGEIIHHCHERLSEHQGHGSAKPPKHTA